jgi:uncharacterized protein
MVDLLVVQPTPFCNINCKYCYLPDRANSKKISLQTLTKIIENVKADKLIENELSIVWHAGEPLTIGADYFNEMALLVEQSLPGVQVTHSVQTNGMLINEKWCDLFKRYNVRIGISLDGPEEINDANRVSRAGKGTLSKTMEGISWLQKNNIPYHAIAVVTEKSLDYPEKIYSFFKENGFHLLGLNIEEIEGANQSSTLVSENFDQKVHAFFSTVFNLYLKSDRAMKIREFDNAFNSILRNPQVLDITKQEIYSHQTSTFGIISVDYEGNFSTFSPELLGQKHALYGDFNLGNVYQNRFREILKTKKFKTISSDIEKGIKQCKKKCEYFHVCGGGAPSNKLYENGSFNSTETIYCKYTIQTPIDIALNYLEKNILIS